MSLKRLSLLTVGASLTCPVTQWLAVTDAGSRQGLWSVMAIVMVIVWITLLVTAMTRHGARAKPLLLTFLPPLAPLVLTGLALIRCGMTDICF